MFNRILSGLEDIAHSVKTGDGTNTEAAIRATRVSIKDYVQAGTARPEGATLADGTVAPLKRLDSELATWQTKLPVILNEPVGRQGIAKHAKYWIDELNKLT